MPKKKAIFRDDPRTIQAAFSRFLAGVPAIRISEEMNLPRQKVYQWADKYNWADHRTAIINSRQTAVAERMKVLIDSNIEGVAIRHLAMSEKIDTQIIRELGKKQKPRALVDLSRAASNSADISGKVVGLTKVAENQGKPLLVQFNLQVRTDGDSDSKATSIVIDTPASTSTERVSAEDPVPLSDF